jgi:hypothetical protein
LIQAYWKLKLRPSETRPELLPLLPVLLLPLLSLPEFELLVMALGQGKPVANSEDFAGLYLFTTRTANKNAA